MKMPIDLLCGKSGSGKSTIAQIIADDSAFVEIVSLADPIKRFCGSTLYLTDKTLWGPAHARNVRDTAPNRDEDWWNYVFNDVAPVALSNLFRELEGVLTSQELDAAKKKADLQLNKWLTACKEDAEKNGGLSPRFALQTFGTEFGRTIFGEDVWVRLAWHTALKLLKGGYEYSYANGLYRSMIGRCDRVVIPDGRFRNEILFFNERNATTWLIERPSNGEAVGVKGHPSETEIDGMPYHFFDFIVQNSGTLKDLENAVFRALANRRARF